MSLKLIENTGWEIALALAIERDKNVERLIDAVLESDLETAQSLAEELRYDEEMLGVTESKHGRAGH